MTSLENTLENIFNKKIKSFVIHLEMSKDRLKLIDNLSQKTKTNINIIDAIDGSVHLDEPHRCPYRCSVECINNNHYRGKGEIGCLLSHLKIWKNMIDNNIDYAIIYEDDCYFSGSLEQLQEVLNTEKELLVKYDGLLLGTIGYRNTQIRINNNLCIFDSFDGTHAMLISNNMASKLIQFYEEQKEKGYLYPADGHVAETIKKYNLKVVGFINNRSYFIQNPGMSYIRYIDRDKKITNDVFVRW